jgi:hypothetical protein
VKRDGVRSAQQGLEIPDELCWDPSATTGSTYGSKAITDMPMLLQI